VNDLLKMDYETFINSAFILQGRADEFTIKTAGERKQVLADILDLEQYDKLEELAKDKAKDRKLKADELDNRVRGIDAELLLKPGYLKELGAVDEELVQQQAALADLRKLLQELRGRSQELQNSKR